MYEWPNEWKLLLFSKTFDLIWHRNQEPNDLLFLFLFFSFNKPCRPLVDFIRVELHSGWMVLEFRFKRYFPCSVTSVDDDCPFRPIIANVNVLNCCSYLNVKWMSLFWLGWKRGQTVIRNNLYLLNTNKNEKKIVRIVSFGFFFSASSSKNIVYDNSHEFDWEPISI